MLLRTSILLSLVFWINVVGLDENSTIPSPSSSTLNSSVPTTPSTSIPTIESTSTTTTPINDYLINSTAGDLMRNDTIEWLLRTDFVMPIKQSTRTKHQEDRITRSGLDCNTDLIKSQQQLKNCQILHDGRSKKKTTWITFIVCSIVSAFLLLSMLLFGFFLMFLKRIAQTDKDSKDTLRGPGNAPGLADLQILPNFSERLDTFKSVSHDKREKHRQFIAARKKQHKEEENSAKFKKRGAIFIPLDIEKCDFKKMANKDPTNVVLTKVVYDESRNEQFDIGTDIDDIELAPSTTECTVTVTKD